MFAMLADDVTGACDTGAPFAGRGAQVYVWLDWREGEYDPGAVHVFNTRTRNEAPDVAAKKVLEIALHLRRRETEIRFKKIDSTCKGNIGAELNALLKAGLFESALLAPAHPLMGRRIRNGMLYVGDSRQPALDLVALARDQGLDCPVLDAESVEDLDCIARSALQQNPAPLLAGSGGLAASLAKLVGLPAASETPVNKAAGPGPVTLFAGSSNPVTLGQLEVLERERHTRDWLVIRLPRGAPLEIGTQRPRAIFLTGGDTAETVLRTAGAAGILLSAEMVPGIPMGRVIGGCWDGLRVATKAGGFGARDAILKVVELLA
jgi:uncharacterized protein YgbK (DUF1537 family)